MKIQSLATGDRQAGGTFLHLGCRDETGQLRTQYCDAIRGGSEGHGTKRQDSHPLSPTVQPALLAGRPGPSRGSLRSPRAASSGPRLREAHPRLGPRSRGGGSRPRESPDAPLRAEGPPHAGLRERAEGTGAADTRDSSPRPATRPARAKVPAQTGDEREASASARSLRRLLARRSHRAAPAFQPPAAQPGARGRRSQSERGNSWGRSRLCSSAQPRPRLVFCRYSALALWTSSLESRFPANVSVWNR